jgi:hypothetical protein
MGAVRGRGEWKVACEAVWLRDVHEAAVACCSWAADGENFASGDVGGSVVVCGATEGAGARRDGRIVKSDMKKWQVRRHSRRVVALAFSKSGVLVLKKKKIYTVAFYNKYPRRLTFYNKCPRTLTFYNKCPRTLTFYNKYPRTLTVCQLC